MERQTNTEEQITVPRASLIRAASTGAIVCALLGPIFGFLAVLAWTVPDYVSSWSRHFDPHQFAGALDFLLALFAIAIISMGVPSALLGAIGGVLIRRRAGNANTSRLKVEASIFGALLGGIVPVIALFAGVGIAKGNMERLIPAGAVAGVACAFATLFLLQRRASWQRYFSLTQLVILILLAYWWERDHVFVWVGLVVASMIFFLALWPRNQRDFGTHR